MSSRAGASLSEVWTRPLMLLPPGFAKGAAAVGSHDCAQLSATRTRPPTCQLLSSPMHQWRRGGGPPGGALVEPGAGVGVGEGQIPGRFCPYSRSL